MVEIDWRRDYKIGEFGCPNPKCSSRDIRFRGNCHKTKKRRFRCGNCGASTVEAIEITLINLSHYYHQLPSIKPFAFEDEQWDLRAINPSFHDQNNRVFIYFQDINLSWFKLQVKQYIYHLCKTNKPFNTIDKHLSSLRFFSRYLAETNVASIDKIDRSTIRDFLIWEQTGCNGIRNRLWTLRNFFEKGNIQKWFEVDEDIIRCDDFPKIKRGNPDPISDTVREQIEKNLHKLPDPIARMWIVAFFTAMRPNELALLKKNCLVQEGSHWKIIWHRQKIKDQHEVPITRIIAKVIQEQREYIEQLWGDSWDYLFCHYQALSRSEPSQPNLQPVKKVIPKSLSPLQLAIRCLIEAENIRNDNGFLAEFSPCLVRPTRLTQLFEQGHDLAVVSAWAGHKRLVTTSTFYTYVSCDLIEKEAGHIQKALFNADGQYLRYESLPKSFWENPRAHQLDLPGNHINTPIYGFCGLPLDQNCEKFRACYTCRCFVPTPEKLSLYIKTRDELRAKESKSKANGQDVLVEQFGRQADQLDKIIASLQEAA
jgi:integrase